MFKVESPGRESSGHSLRATPDRHPLTWLSHMLDCQLFGSNPHGHHTTNIFWHALNAVMAFLALRRLTGAFWTSAVCAALFAWHPLRVESVAWVSERKDLLCAFFGLLTLWAYAVYAEKRQENNPLAWRHYMLAVAAFAAGLLSKPMLVTLPCLLLLLDRWPLPTSRFDRDNRLALARENAVLRIVGRVVRCDVSRPKKRRRRRREVVL